MRRLNGNLAPGIGGATGDQLLAQPGGLTGRYAWGGGEGLNHCSKSGVDVIEPGTGEGGCGTTGTRPTGIGPQASPQPNEGGRHAGWVADESASDDAVLLLRGAGGVGGVGSAGVGGTGVAEAEVGGPRIMIGGCRAGSLGEM
jgi:hypothetical protein